MNAIITAVNDRRHISPLIFECFKRLSEKFGDLALIVAYTSDEDGAMVQQWAVEHPHVHPVGPIRNVAGIKFDIALKYAYDSVSNFDGFIIMGDDDSISSDYYHLITSFGYDYAGTNTCGFLDVKSGQAMRHEYSTENKLIGAGRYISREAIRHTCIETKVRFIRECHLSGKSYNADSIEVVTNDAATYLVDERQAKLMHRDKWVGLWRHEGKRALDHMSEVKLVVNGFVPVPFNTEEIHVTDCKSYAGESPTNIWPYSILEKKCKSITFEQATWFMNDAELKIIKAQ